MPGPGRYGRRWRESTIEALERELRELHRERSCPWDRFPAIPFRVGRFTEWLSIHPAVVLHLGRPRAQFLAEPGWEPFIHPRDARRADLLWLRCSLGGRPYSGLEYRWRHADSGRYVCLSESLFPASWGQEGKPLRMDGWFENITRRKRAEIEFLVACLDASGHAGRRDARLEVIHRVRLEHSHPPVLLPLLGPERGGRRRLRR